VYLGVVERANAGNGIMYVRVQNGFELDELHNVQAQSPSLNDTLYYDNIASPPQWKTASIATILGFTPEPAITTLPISKGGTNSGTALSNNRVMQSSGSAIVEASAITAARALKSDANGIPTHFDTATEPSLTELALVKGVTGSAIQTQIDGKASKTFVESISLQDSGTSIAAATYTIELYANYAYTINELKIIADAGTCTANLKINSTSVTSISAVSVSNSIATATASGANTVAVGDKITLVTTSNSGLNNLQLTIKTTRI
jgi:hypothetical protein